MTSKNVSILCNNYNNFETLNAPLSNINTNIKDIDPLNILMLNTRSIINKKLNKYVSILIISNLVLLS